MIAKRRSALKSLHEQIRNKTVDKRYFALVAGTWPKTQRLVNAPLLKNTLQSGERVVRVSSDGKASETRFNVQQRYQGATLVEAMPITGRTHQIRVHCQHVGHCIAGDPKYADKQFEEALPNNSRRLFLHAHRISFDDPRSGKRITIDAAMDKALNATLAALTRV